MDKKVAVIGGGLAGSEASLCLARQGIQVSLYEMRPIEQTPVHRTSDFAELVCSNSLKSQKEDSAAGMLKNELDMLGSELYACALESSVKAGGALAVDRSVFSEKVTALIEEDPFIEIRREEVSNIADVCKGHDAVIVATGPMTSDLLARSLEDVFGEDSLAFYDAAAPIVMADSIDMDVIFSQSRYEEGAGDYLNAPFQKDEYEKFIDALVSAEKVIKKDFETNDLFQACQPIEEIAKKGADAPRFGPMKPVGLIDPNTGKRPWAVVQLRAEDESKQSFNLVGFQTNLTFGEQKRVFRMIPGLENAEFARLGVMHRNTFIDAPKLIDVNGRLKGPAAKKFEIPVFIAGQLSGTEGYCEAMRSGINCAIGAFFELKGSRAPLLPTETVFGSLMEYASSVDNEDYQPMHVNFGIIDPLQNRIRSKKDRYKAYAERGDRALREYVRALTEEGFRTKDE